jgi:hypothetical protein
MWLLFARRHVMAISDPPPDSFVRFERAASQGKTNTDKGTNKGAFVVKTPLD